MIEGPYRLAALVIVVGILAVVRFYRWRAAQTGERIIRTGESWPLFLSIRLCGVAMGLALLVYLISPAALAWSRWPLPAAVRWLGAGLGIVSGIGMYWTLSHLDRNLTDTTHVRQNARLITSGPYRYVRHPMYATLLLMTVGVSLLIASGFLLLCGIVTVVLLAIRVPEEERQLAARFGDDYRTYQARTGRFFPRWR